MEFGREGVEEIKINRTQAGSDNSTVYDTLETWFTDKTKFDTEIEIEIYRGDRTGTLYYAGYFSICDATIDKEYRTFKITPLIDDSYRAFVDEGETEYEIRGIGFNKEIIIGDLHTFGAWNQKTPGAAGNNFDAFVGAGGALTSIIDSDAVNTEAANQSLGNLTSGQKIILDVTAYTLNAGTPIFADIWNIADGSITVEGGQQLGAVGKYEWTINSTVVGYIVLYTTPGNQVTNMAITFIIIKNGVLYTNVGLLITDFITALLNSYLLIGAAFGTVKSTFFDNDALPSDAPSSIVTFMTSYPNGNYVSGNTASNPLNGFMIAEIRDFVTADINENLISFNQLMSDLKEVFQVGWYIDADGDFRLEHIKYFEKLIDDSTALDITGAAYTKYKPETDKKELKFNKALLANREQFRWQQVDTVANSPDFVGHDIYYNQLETIANVIKHEPRNVTTDIQYLVDNPGDASASGFTYLQCAALGSGNYYVEFETGILSAADVLNGHFSWANLQDKYWTWRRMSENGDMNSGNTVAFDSAIKFLEQSDIKFVYTSTLNIFTKITASQGTAQQMETKRDLDTDFLTLIIVYNPYA